MATCWSRPAWAALGAARVKIVLRGTVSGQLEIDQLLYLKPRASLRAWRGPARHLAQDDPGQGVVVLEEDPVARQARAPVLGGEVELGQDLVLGVGVVDLLALDPERGRLQVGPVLEGRGQRLVQADLPLDEARSVGRDDVGQVLVERRVDEAAQRVGRVLDHHLGLQDVGLDRGHLGLGAQDLLGGQRADGDLLAALVEQGLGPLRATGAGP